MTKETVVAAIKEMPQEFDVDELIEKLIFISRVEEGLKQVDEGNKTPLDDVKQIVVGWQK
jgi:hypothetical protein